MWGEVDDAFVQRTMQSFEAKRAKVMEAMQRDGLTPKQMREKERELGSINAVIASLIKHRKFLQPTDD